MDIGSLVCIRLLYTGGFYDETCYVIIVGVGPFGTDPLCLR